ncbi:hypothetical protein HK104_005695 [Borealophlyctis nickersoniae]|nr:hypothetical protein HK104_005695 [Borealophlyctis nickersoniae]
MFTIVCKMVAKPEHVADLSKQLAHAATVYSKDKGTIAWYANQHVKNPAEFVLVEVYESEADVKTHTANPYFAQHNAIVKPWVKSFELSYYKSCTEGGSKL